ncbi:hypothetical protein HK100_006938 [Physocladia obscura]|uniref:Ras GTPase-activating-like protein IQGAP2 n=1 Tax=Physocladia obscura TaxID=109957 RepID=A0AAD5XF20_9FUNG|nr:hypothetical protein HK100_006938 [Physocladia obscura]
MADVLSPSDHGKHGRVRLQRHSADINKNTINEDKKDGSWMDRERHDIQTYEYLCHIEEAKEWMETCIKEEIAQTTELEEEMRNGISLAKLAKSFHPESVRKIFENRNKLQYKHSDNINFLFDAMRAVGLPEIFFFTTTDLYEKKNFPKVVYCIHALSHILAAKRLAPSINNLVGKLTFTEDQIEETQQSLEASGVLMPQFGNIENALAAASTPRPEKKYQENERMVYETETNDHFRKNIAKLIQIQSLVRSKQARKIFNDLREADRVYKITKIQAIARTRNAKHLLTAKKYKKAEEDKKIRWKELSSKEQLFIKLQARVRGKKERIKYKARIEHFNNNADAIVKIQALWRAKQMRNAFQNLTLLENPPVRIIQDFVHLLDDSDRDFEDDLDIENLRQRVVEAIRENAATESELNELDLKIALLIKNRIDIEEVYHQTLSVGASATTTTAYYKKLKNSITVTGNSEPRFSDLSATEKCASPFTQRVLDKEARKKLEAYQQLFYLLQTNPNYLAKLMYTLNKQTAGSILKVLEQVTLTLFGYAQNIREEYLLLNLIKTAIKLEINEIEKLDEFWRSNPLFIKLVLQYVRGAKERQYFRNLFQPLIKIILNNKSLDLETDPTFVYKNLIRQDESESGENSKRPYDATVEQISADIEVQETIKTNTQKLTSIVKEFMSAIINSLKNMPFGIRYISLQLKLALKDKFPDSDEEILKIVGNLIYYRYMNPAIIAPEGFDIIETSISPTQRRNLAEVHAALNNNVDDIISEKNDPLKSILEELGPAPSPSETTKHEVYLNLVNRLSSPQNSQDLAKHNIKHLVSETKRLILILIKLQGGKTLLEILESPTSRKEEEDFQTHTSADLAKLEERQQKKDMQEWRKFVDSGSGQSLIQHNVGDTTETASIDGSTSSKLTDKSNWKQFVDNGTLLVEQLGSSVGNKTTGVHKLNRVISPRSSQTFSTRLGVPLEKSLFFGSGSLFCLKSENNNSLTFDFVKRRALENMEKLEELGLVKRENGYQDMINMIAQDMLNRHKRKNQRKAEAQSLRKTLLNLKEKSKTKLKKTPFIFSRQYFHLKELQKSGSVPQFGSFKFTAADLYKRGVLMSIGEYTPKQYSQISLTISSAEAGIFTIDVSALGVKLTEPIVLKLEELLQNQYDGVQTIVLFDLAKVNVNLMTYLLNKKFYV